MRAADSGSLEGFNNEAAFKKVTTAAKDKSADQIHTNRATGEN